MKLEVKVKTGKRETRVTKKDFARYEVWVKARPVKGAANKELIEVLADYFSVKPSSLRIVRGFKITNKVIELTK
jgi:uncharacterized protein YggU (UPF0235/DUF167 family)